MLRVIHAYNIKPGVEEQSFVEWLDSKLDETTRRFGCIGRKTWVFLDGFEGTYERHHDIRRPKYLNEAFWVGEEASNNFRKWLLSPTARNSVHAGSARSRIIRYCATSTTNSPLR